MLYALKRLLELLRAILPVQLFYIFICCICCYYYQTDIKTAVFVILGGSVIFFLSAAAGAVGDYAVKRANSPDRKLIGDSIDGFSKTSRLFKVAVAELREGMFNEALEDFKEVEDLDISERERAVLCFYIGTCYRDMGYPTNAANYFVKSIDNNIDIDYVYILAARCCVANGSFSKAMELYNDLLGRNSYFDYIYTDMGMCCLKSEDADKALEYFTRSIGEQKNYAFALGGCSLAYLMKKDVEKSKEFFARALINNIGDLDGFRKYYCSIAEAAGCLDLIDEYMRTAAEKNDDNADEVNITDLG